MTEQGRKKLHDLIVAIQGAQDHARQAVQAAEVAAVKQGQTKAKTERLQAELARTRQARAA